MCSDLDKQHIMLCGVIRRSDEIFAVVLSMYVNTPLLLVRLHTGGLFICTSFNTSVKYNLPAANLTLLGV